MARLVLRVKPGSKRPGFAREGEGYVLRVAERAVDGAANAACIQALAAIFHIAPSRVTLLHGAHSRTKQFAIDGFDAAMLDRHVRSVSAHRP